MVHRREFPFRPGMNRRQIQDAVAPLLDALARAGDAIERVQSQRNDDGVDVERKGDGSPVTAADLASHGVLEPFLQDAWPDIPVVSEEGWVPGHEVPASGWFIDPLDGTKEFIKRNGEYVVNVGLVEDGLPVFGVVHVPATGEQFVGGFGLGSWRIQDGVWNRLSASPFDAPPLRVVASRSHRGPLVDGMLEDLHRQGLTFEAVPLGSAWKLVLVAEGKADCYPRLGPTMWWDTAAPQAVVEGAGGRVLDETGQRFRYTLAPNGDPRNPAFLVLGPAGIHDDAIRAAFNARAPMVIRKA